MKILRAIGGFLLSFVFLMVFLYASSGVKWIFNIFLQNVQPAASVSGAVANVSQNNSQPQVLKPDINAAAAISAESNLSGGDKILFQKNSEAKLPIASLTKLMTAVVVLDNYDLSKSITVDKLADAQDPMKQDVNLGDSMPIENFLDIMLIGSSNKSAYALSEVVGEPAFVDLMNKKAKEIGLENTIFEDPTGLSTQDISTASDLTKLAEYILKNYSKIADISRIKELNIPKFGKITSTNELLGEVPEIVCGKTGFTTGAKGCLLLVVDNQKNNDYIINVILGADDRFLEMRKLIDWQNAVCNKTN
jgi:D-alanyl-D-alanine carboxypeptidase (penicillin-binding protein 5/6)